MAKIWPFDQKRKAIHVIWVAILYFLLAEFVCHARDFTGNTLAVWPVSGFALASVLIYGKLMAFGAGLGSLVFHLLGFASAADLSLPPVSAALVMSFGSILEFLLAAGLIGRYFSNQTPETLWELIPFIWIAVLSGAVGAGFGELGQFIGPGMNAPPHLATGLARWLEETAGMLLFTPPLLVWNIPQLRKGLLFPLIAPCVGLTLTGFLMMQQFEDRLFPDGVDAMAGSRRLPILNTGELGVAIGRIRFSWNILLAGMALTWILGMYLERHRRELKSLQESKERLKRQSRALSRLTRNNSINAGDFDETMKILTETTAETLQVDRASIWLFNHDRTSLYCADLYQMSVGCHSEGLELLTTDYPSYFKALLGARNIAVDDAVNDPVTAELGREYLPKFNISSLLDAPIQVGDVLFGVVCHEHVGLKRHWTLDEQNFAGSIADLAALTFEVVKRKAAEEALHIVNRDLESKVRERTDELEKLNASLLEEVRERKQTELILRESELRLRLATKAADIGVWDWNLVNDSVIFSPEWKRQIGYDENELSNHYREWESRLHPDDRERAVTANRVYIEGKAAEYGAEFRLRHKNGTYRWIYSRGEVVARTKDGKATRIMGCHVDITELKQAEEALKAFRWFAESAGQGMGMARPNGEVVYTNPALTRTLKALGLSMDRPRLLTDYYTDESGRKLKSEVLPTLIDSGQWTGELELGSSSADHIPTLENFFAVCNESGQPQYVANIITDMSQQKEMEKQLLMAKEAAESADRAKSMFIASMSHELRTPLNAIIGFTGVMLQGLSGNLNERQYDQLSRVSRSAKHLLALITDIIDISKIEAGRIDVAPETFDLQDAMAHAVDTVREAAREKNLVLDIDVSDRIVMFSDRKRVLQCVINLLSNAVKYTERGGVAVIARATEKEVVVEVRDTGIGIGPEQLQRLFVPFERLDSFLRLRTSGTGLGLYLTRKIAADLLNGSVEVSSEPGVGSCFILRIAKNLLPGESVVQASG
ncbi:MAG: ATP-binding protein [Gammaproteobacteria bacterium]